MISWQSYAVKHLIQPADRHRPLGHHLFQMTQTQRIGNVRMSALYPAGNAAVLALCSQWRSGSLSFVTSLVSEPTAIRQNGLMRKNPPFARALHQCRMRSIRFDYKVMQCLSYTTEGSVNAGPGYPPRRTLLPCALGGALRRGQPYIRKAPLSDRNLLVRQTGPCLGDNS